MSIVPSTRATANTKYTREILKRLPAGYRIAYGTDDETTGNRVVGHHPLLFNHKGNLVRHTNGMPVRICGTPGSRFSMIKDLTEIKRAGVPIK